MPNTKVVAGNERKIFDPRDPACDLRGAELLDATVVKRGDQWWMYVAGQAQGFGPTDLYSATLPPGAPLSPLGWELTRDAHGQLAPLAARSSSARWDANGGRHCPSYVRGWSPQRQQWVERIYYAGAAENLWGPYTIGFLEWDGHQWIDQPEPVVVAEEEWEHGSVYEPNLVYHDGKWRMWFVAGANQDDYLVHGYTESANGVSGWSKHIVFAPPEMKMFDFCVCPYGKHFAAVFSRVWVGQDTPAPETGLWWCTAEEPSAKLSDWSAPVQITTAESRQWHAGAWKPSFQFQDEAPGRALIFFDGSYRTDDPGPFPFAFTLGCLELRVSETSLPAE